MPPSLTTQPTAADDGAKLNDWLPEVCFKTDLFSDWMMRDIFKALASRDVQSALDSPPLFCLQNGGHTHMEFSKHDYEALQDGEDSIQHELSLSLRLSV